jgi:diguanylate cyclase (GGDEF)-like protein
MATLLLIDHQPARRDLLVMTLEQEGHHVIEAESGEQALEVMRVVMPDLVLLDVLAAPPGGYQFIRRLHASDLLHGLRIVFLAAPYIEAEARLLALASGAAGVVADISDSAALLATLQQALATPLPAAGVPGETALDGPLYQMVACLYGRIAQLEMLNARLERKSILGADLLDVARSALDEEVIKRLHAEEDLLQENLRLRRESVRDPLTGLYNRRYLEESLTREESRAKRAGWPLSMMMIDIDHFKQYNDTYGHAAGDEVLRAVSRCLESLARSEDIVCRYGGEEFVLVMTNTAPNTLWQRANALRDGILKLHIEHDHHPLGPVTLSIGLAIYPDNGESARAALQAADVALYQAKHAGRDRIIPATHH